MTKQRHQSFVMIWVQYTPLLVVPKDITIPKTGIPSNNYTLTHKFIVIWFIVTITNYKYCMYIKYMNELDYVCVCTN